MPWKTLNGLPSTTVCVPSTKPVANCTCGGGSGAAACAAGGSAHESDTASVVITQPWPVAEEALLASDTVTVIVQVNGKLRARVEAPAEAPQEDLLALAKANGNVTAHLDGKEIVKEIVVPGKLVNLVVR